MSRAAIGRLARRPTRHTAFRIGLSSPRFSVGASPSRPEAPLLSLSVSAFVKALSRPARSAPRAARRRESLGSCLFHCRITGGVKPRVRSRSVSGEGTPRWRQGVAYRSFLKRCDREPRPASARGVTAARARALLPRTSPRAPSGGSSAHSLAARYVRCLSCR